MLHPLEPLLFTYDASMRSQGESRRHEHLAALRERHVDAPTRAVTRSSTRAAGLRRLVADARSAFTARSVRREPDCCAA